MTRSSVLDRAAALPVLKRHGPRDVVVWTPDHESLLGTASDRELADFWGVEDSAVYHRRRLLAIPAFGNRGRPQPWTPAMIATLRDHHDRDIAKRFGITAASVAIKRRELRIEKELPHHLATTWTPAMLQELGKRLDGELAHEFGLSIKTVSAKRRELGIPRLRPTKIDWEATAVRKLLGSASDGRIADILDVAVETVRIKRTEAGIAPYQVDHWTPAVIARMGTVPDRVVAEEIGVDPAAVAWQRRQRGIRRWDGRRKKGDQLLVRRQRG
jgi:DNA-binding CsgD family transcriptional regulator